MICCKAIWRRKWKKIQKFPKLTKSNIAVLYGKQNEHNTVKDEKLDRLREFCTSIQTLAWEAVLDSMQPWHFPSLLLWTSVNFPSSFINLLPSKSWWHQSSTNRSVLEPFHIYFAALNMQPKWVLEKIMSGLECALFTENSQLTFVWFVWSSCQAQRPQILFNTFISNQRHCRDTATNILRAHAHLNSCHPVEWLRCLTDAVLLSLSAKWTLLQFCHSNILLHLGRCKLSSIRSLSRSVSDGTV